MLATYRQAAQAMALLRWREQGGYTCRACRAKVLMIENVKSGKTMIINALPNYEKGNIVLQQHDRRLKAKVVTKQEREDLLQIQNEIALYLDHHASCPMVAKFR